MIEFIYPLAFILLILPLVTVLLPLSYESKKQALYFSNISYLEITPGSENSLKPIVESSWLTRLSMFLVYALLVIAMAKPILIEEPIIKEESLREVLICIDLSASMEAKDFRLSNGKVVDRLLAQKEVLGNFIKTLKHENFALIFYGSAAFVQSPFSSDNNASLQLLSEAQIGMAGPKTVIGDAIGLSIKLFNEKKTKDRLVILMSDGTDSGSKIPPLKAAQLAKKNNIKIETIAVGNIHAKGEEKVDIFALQKIAKITGGDFYFAEDTKSLKNIYQEIDKLNPKRVKVHSFRPTKELFTYPLLAAFSLLMLFTLTRVIFSFIRTKDVS